MLSPTRIGTRAMALVVALLIAAACSSSGGASTAPSTAASVAPPSVAPASVAPSEEASAEPSEAAEESYELTIAKSATLGDYIAGEDGKTLYTFTPDTAPNKSTCNGDCAGT